MREAEFLLQEGATPRQIDHALTTFGFPMGPFAVRDLAGLDIGWAMRKSIQHLRRSDQRYSTVGDEICERGWFGQKTNKGFYCYEPGSRQPMENPDVAEIIAQSASAENITPRNIDDAEIIQRCLYAVVNEGAKVLSEGIATQSSDIDLAWMFGYGFPRWRGGPMHWAEEIGLAKIVEQIKRFADTHDFWHPAPLLIECANSNKKLIDYSH